MPAVFDQDEAPGEASASGDPGDDADWSVITGSPPRFRSGDGDWDDDGFADELAEAAAADPEMQGGALGERESDPTESDEEFAAAAAQKRSGSRDIDTPRRAPNPARPVVRKPTGTDPASPSGRDLPVALATAGLLAAVAVACFVAGEGLTALLAAAILGAAGAELVSTLRRKNLATAHLVVIVGSAAMPLAAWWRGPLGVAVVSGLVVMTTLLWFLFEAGPGRPLIGSAMTLFAFAWIGGLGAFVGLLLDQEQGVEWLLAALIPTICYDVFGYFCGQQFGRTPLAPKVSPNKTLEGTVGGVLLAIGITAAALNFLQPFDGHSSWMVFIGLLAAIGAFFGDLCQSMIKRDLGIKDFSATLPGHGGILDRFDGLLFALPTVYFLMLHFVTP
jgi:phosphatidate cytidylyltransferase